MLNFDYDINDRRLFVKKLAFILIAMNILITFSACGKTNEKDAGIAIPILETADVNYSTVEATLGSISEEKHVAGSVSTPYNQNISFLSQNGTIKEYLLVENISVKAGDMIASLKSDDVDYSIQQQQLNVDVAKSTYDSLVADNTDKDAISYAKIDYAIELNSLNSLISSLDNLIIYAPFDGVITWCDNLKPGDKIEQNQVIATINDTNKIAVTCPADELGELSFGLDVIIKQGALYEYKGKFAEIIETGWRGELSAIITIPEDAVFSDLGGVDVIFITKHRENTVIVPSKAIQKFSGRNYVNVLLNNVKVEFDVEIGITTSKNTEIISGLSGGEKIIIN